MKRLKEFFSIPPEIRPEFWRDTLQKNHVSLLVVSVIIFGTELYNMARVLFWSASGLGTLNNRIYFGMYCALCLAAALYLLLQRLLRAASDSARWRLQFGVALFFLLWHVCLNAYDIMGASTPATTVYLTAILGIAVFIRMPSPHALFCHGLSYGLFMLLSAKALDPGARLNLTITAIVALAISWTSCHHAVLLVSQRWELHQINLRLQDIIQKDPLTGLLNKTAFQSALALALQDAAPSRPVTMLMMDLDGFKAVNDTYGHPCGDHVLQQMSAHLRAVFPDALGVGRVGGDEFAVILSGADRAGAEAAARRLIRLVTQITWKGEPTGAGCSVGICRVSRPARSSDCVYEQADQALYEAKHRGKGDCSFRELA